MRLTSSHWHFIVALLAVIAFSFTHCSFGPENTSGQLNGGTAGVKTFASLVSSYSTVTGVPLTNPQVNTFYQSARPRLSLEGNAESVNPAMLLAAVGMAGTFCNQLVTTEAALPAASRRVFNDVDFSKNQSFLTPAIRTAMIQKLAEAFWLRAAEENEVNELLAAMSAAEQGTVLSTTEMRSLLLISCTIVGGSLDFLVN